MTDLRLVWDAAWGEADLAIDGADLAADDGLETAVIISLFTDRRVEEDELPAGETDRRGYWGDDLNEEPGDLTGSKLWLLSREKETPEVLVRAEEYSLEALEWLVTDGHVRAVQAVASWVRRGVLALCIVLDLRDGSAREYQFQDVRRAA